MSEVMVTRILLGTTAPRPYLRAVLWGLGPGPRCDRGATSTGELLNRVDSRIFHILGPLLGSWVASVEV